MKALHNPVTNTSQITSSKPRLRYSKRSLRNLQMNCLDLVIKLDLDQSMIISLLRNL